MQIDFRLPLLGLDGEALQADGQPLTLERVVIIALLQPVDKMPGEEKYRRYDMMRRIHGAAGPVELTVEQVAYVKQAVGDSVFTALVVGQAWDMLEHPQSG